MGLTKMRSKTQIAARVPRASAMALAVSLRGRSLAAWIRAKSKLKPQRRFENFKPPESQFRTSTRTNTRIYFPAFCGPCSRQAQLAVCGPCAIPLDPGLRCDQGSFLPALASGPVMPR